MSRIPDYTPPNAVSIPRICGPLEAEKTALILIDLQNDFLDPEGAYGKTGVDIGHMRAIIEPVRSLVAFCRAHGIEIVVTEYACRGRRDGGPVFDKRPALREDGGRGLREGTWGVETIPELGVGAAKGDWLIRRKRMSAFYATSLEQLLRDLGKSTILIAGVVTGSCCESTARDASFRNFDAIMVADCCGSVGGTIIDPVSREETVVTAEEMHHASLRACSMIVCDVMTSAEIMKEVNEG